MSTQNTDDTNGVTDDAATETDDYTIENEMDSDHAADTTQSQSKKVEKLKKKLKKAQEEKQDYLEEIQRQKAEFQNLRKRDEQKKQQDIQNANERLIIELLPVIDSFEMAFADKQAYEQTPENWRRGVEYIYAQLLSTLEGFGVAQLDPHGQPFDPAYHEAVERVDVESNDEVDTVTDVIQKGYQLNDKIIRSAKVRVGARGENTANDTAETNEQ